MRFEAALVGVAPVTNLALVNTGSLLFDLVIMVPHVVLQVGQLRKSPLTVLKFTPIWLFTWQQKKSYICMTFLLGTNIILYLYICLPG